MTFNDKINVMVGFRNYVDKRKITKEEIEKYVRNLNLKRFYMEETETKETIENYLLDLYKDAILGREVINPETYEIEYIIE